MRSDLFENLPAVQPDRLRRTPVALLSKAHQALFLRKVFEREMPR
jgi:hypothetical protein